MTNAIMILVFLCSVPITIIGVWVFFIWLFLWRDTPDERKAKERAAFRAPTATSKEKK